MYEPETQRLQFMQDRDGLDGAIDFAKRTMVLYRRHVIQKRCPRESRRSFIESYLAFKRFLYDQRSITTTS